MGVEDVHTEISIVVNPSTSANDAGNLITESQAALATGIAKTIHVVFTLTK